MKKYNIQRAFLSLLAAVLMVACGDDFVEVDPINENSEDFFNTEEDYQEALVGAYDLLQATYLNVMVGEIASDNTLAGGESATDTPGIQEIDNMTHTPVNQQLRDIWGWMFAGVNRANYILEFQDKIEFSGKDQIIAQARFLRAYYYFELVKWFGDVPLAVDQRLLFGDQFNVDRTPRAEVYAQIEQDLIFAAETLPATQAEEGRITSGAARALLGKAYLYGWHLDSAPQKAVALFRDSAEAEDPRGMNALGYCLQRGIGTEQDYKAALKWLEKANVAGNAEGANNLGNSYCLGWGVGVDESKALELYRKAAEAGSAKGMYNVAKCYHLGLGVEKNRELALEWLEKAAAKDDIEALLFLGWEHAYGEREGEQVDKGVEYFTKAANLGSSEAMVSLGKIAARQDKEKTSTEWFRKAAEKGDPEGQFLYGGALLYGEGVDEDRAAAMEWLKKAADRGHLNAKELLESEERKSKPD